MDTPVLYLSRYINQNKTEYYRLLQAVREDNSWEEWVMFMLEGIHQTSYQTINLINDIKELMNEHKQRIRSELPKIYSQDLINHLFSHPWTKISYVEKELYIHRHTATKYLNQLVDIGMLSSIKFKNDTYFINQALKTLLLNVNT